MYVKPGKGKSSLHCNHNNDTKIALQLIGNWIINLSYFNNDLLKTNLLIHLIIIIEQLLNYTQPSVSSENNTESSDSTILTPYSLFGVKVFFRLHQIKLEDLCYNFRDDDFQKIGLQIGLDFFKNRKQFLQQKQVLEEPNSLEEYRLVLPLKLYELLDSII